MKRFAAFAALLSTLLFAHAASADTITLSASLDGTLIQDTNASAQLSNGQGDIFVGRTNQDGSGPATISIRRGLLEFNIAGNLPADATITGVMLTLQDQMGLNGSQTISLYRVLQAWGQGGSFQNGGMGAAAQNNDATWLYTFYDAADPSASPTWNAAGGSFSSTLSASTVDTDTSGMLEQFSWSSTQMVADVQYWLDNPTDDFGWLLQGNESTGQTAKRFDGMYSTTPPEVAPSLVITYSVPEPSAIVLLLAGGASLVLAWGMGRRFC